MLKFDCITVGGASEDITFYTNEGVLINNKKDLLKQKLLAFEYGAKIKADIVHKTYGGGAANAAVCMSRLGLNVGIITCLGIDNRAKEIKENFLKYKVNIYFIQKSKLPTDYYFLVAGADKEHIAFTQSGSKGDLKIGPKEKKILNNSKCVYITSLSGDWRKVLKNIFDKPKHKIAWNPGQTQLEAGISVLKKYIKKTDVLIMNKDEALEFVLSDKKKRRDKKILNNVKNLLKIAKEYCGGMVVITNGEKGAYVYDGEKIYHQAILRQKKIEDTTGVGDAFGSTFVTGLKIYKGDIQKSMLLGVTNTASVVQQVGAQNGLISKKNIPK